jgi:S-adenosyl-L-methionine hydrolase (adenosine-forming)
MPTIALLTDFGDSDGFVGMIKGVILRIAPDCNIIDITHDIESFNIKSAAFILQKSVRYFPEGTIFLVVVDPGVGSGRRIIAAQSDSFRFIAPDNGILGCTLAEQGKCRVVSVENQKHMPADPVRTFHGRDIMAPVAAHLANGLGIEELGPEITSYHRLPIPNLLKHPQSVIGEIMRIDKFGNLVSNITLGDLPQGVGFSQLRVTIGDAKNIKFSDYYAAGEGPSAIISGYGTVEVFVNRGSAAAILAQSVGATIAVEVAI